MLLLIMEMVSHWFWFWLRASVSVRIRELNWSFWTFSKVFEVSANGFSCFFFFLTYVIFMSCIFVYVWPVGILHWMQKCLWLNRRLFFFKISWQLEAIPIRWLGFAHNDLLFMYSTSYKIPTFNISWRIL